MGERGAEDERAKVGGGENAPADGSVKAVNMLCIVGAIIGIASMFLVWSSYERGFAIVTNTLTEHLELIVRYSVINRMFLGECIFCAGVFLSLATAAGGFVQLLGLSTILWGYHEWSENVSSMGLETGVGIGLFIGILSTGIVLLSMVKPVGIGYSEKGFRSVSERLKVICATRPNGKEPPLSKRTKMPSALRIIASDKKWSALLVSLVAISASFAAGMSYHRSTFEPVEVIPGGVAWKMGEGVVGFGGSSLFRITFNDSVQSVFWNVTKAQTNSTTFAAYDLGYQQLGELNLSLTYIHFGGRTAFGFGDALCLIVNENSTFKEDTEYRLTYSWLRPRPVIHWGSSINILRITAVIGVGFEFHDGEMSSWEIRSSYDALFSSPKW